MTRNNNKLSKNSIGKFIGMSLIRFYQITFSSFIGFHCRHIPTCSEYSYEAISKYGFWFGLWISFLRIIRCCPFGTRGFDPVPKIKKNFIKIFRINNKSKNFFIYIFFITIIFYYLLIRIF